MAVTVVLAVPIVNVVGLVLASDTEDPVPFTDQPVKVNPSFGVAVRVTFPPSAIAAPEATAVEVL